MKATVYTLRVLLDSEGEAYRDIEITSDANFKDLHLAIVDAVKFEGNELASFYVCDNNWKRETEIALMEMNDMSALEDQEEEEEEIDLDEGDEEDDDESPKSKKSDKKSKLRKVEDDDEPKKGKKSKKEKILVMQDEVLGNHIKNAGQKLIYIYDYYELWTFYIELSKIGESDPKATYPRCIKKVGKLPEKSSNELMADEEELDSEFEEFATTSSKKKSSKGKKDVEDDFDEDLDNDFEDDLGGEFEDGYDDDDLDRFSKYN